MTLNTSGPAVNWRIYGEKRTHQFLEFRQTYGDARDAQLPAGKVP